MNSLHLRLYIYESQSQDGFPLYEWLLTKAKEIGIEGGTVFRSIASFGKNQVVHEEHFFELGADLAVEVSFILSEDLKNQLLASLTEHNIRVFYLTSEVRSGYTS